MINFENTEVVGFEAAIRGMRNPMNSWGKSDSSREVPDCGACPDEWRPFHAGSNDLTLMKKLRNAGTDHRKFMRMIVVYVDITAPLYWWKEFDTYKVGTVANSCSTMHKIADKEFALDDFSHDHLMMRDDGWPDIDGYTDDDGQFTLENFGSGDLLQTTINMLNFHRNLYLTAPNPDDKEIDWWQMIQLLPSSYNQRRTVMMSYEVLANIYKSRKNHKLDEWSEHVGYETATLYADDKPTVEIHKKEFFGFCDWIKTLPYSELITGDHIEKSKWIKIEPGCKMPDEGEEVLITIWSDDSYGKGTDISNTVTQGDYRKFGGYISASCEDLGGFDTVNDWDEGQPIKVTAWAKLPAAFNEEK